MADREMIRQRGGAPGGCTSTSKGCRDCTEEVVGVAPGEKQQMNTKVESKRGRRLNHFLGVIILISLCYFQIGLLFVFDLDKISFNKGHSHEHAKNRSALRKTPKASTTKSQSKSNSTSIEGKEESKQTDDAVELIEDNINSSNTSSVNNNATKIDLIRDGDDDDNEDEDMGEELQTSVSDETNIKEE